MTVRTIRVIPWVLATVGLAGCRGTLELEPDDSATVLSRQLLDAPNPALPGQFEVRRLYYGSGTDQRRVVYRDSVAFTTDPVDASELVDLGDDLEERNDYWGFSPEEFPLNARVWYPDGAGPFPLVLVVHGNHDMKDFSDPGYGYLGELLASRGFILASIDMNFLNGGIRQENDARGWMLLQHLRAWEQFSRTEGNPFEGKVDMERIALIGHSRGGEAVAHAAAFNRLDRYPDNANVEFDFGFAIRSIVAIAPVDGQYRPADQFMPLRNVNYLVFHGSHDGDVTSFHGLRQYHRVSFTGPADDSPAAFGATGEGGPGAVSNAASSNAAASNATTSNATTSDATASDATTSDATTPNPAASDDVPLFKAAVYVYRANHGQWNTVWGAHDNGPRSGRILDLRGLLDPEDQRRFAEIYISAFLETTLEGDERYLPMFRDHRVIGGWLPRTMYITRFRTSSFRPVATFDEDVDVTRGTVAGVELHGERLATWREGELDLRSQNEQRGAGTQQNQAVWLGWNRRTPGEDTTNLSPPPHYTVRLPAALPAAWQMDAGSSLELLLAPTDDVPEPPTSEDEPNDQAEDDEPEAREGDEGAEGDDDDGDEDPAERPIDLTIELVDADGDAAGLPLSRYGAIRRPLEIHILRRDGWDEDRFDQLYELVLQGYSLPLADFVEVQPALDPERLREVRFVFDRGAVAGTVVVDEIGFARLDPAFRRVAVPD